MIKKPDKSLIREVLKHSNWIEREYSPESVEDAIRAWRYAYKNMDNIDLKYVLKVHEILMRRLNLRIAGKVRTCDVRIAGNMKYFISESLLKEEIKGWCKICDTDKIKNFSDEKKEKIIKDWHVTFEHLHVFEDHNGRSGRLLMNIHRIKVGLEPLLILGPAKNRGLTIPQKEYYDWFN